MIHRISAVLRTWGLLAVVLVGVASCAPRHDDFTQGADTAKDQGGGTDVVDVAVDVPVEEVADSKAPDETEADLFVDAVELLDISVEEVDDVGEELPEDAEVDAGCDPDAPDEVGDGIDQNCDGADGVDSDGDSYASVESGGDDCDDSAESSYPGADDEVGDETDQNCDGADGVDGDGDSHANLESGGDDCDDLVETVYPGAADAVGDDTDQNCDGLDGVDADGDSHASVDSGGDDCEDSVETTYPGAADFVLGACSDPVTSAATEVVDEEGSTGYYSSAAFGPDGTLYVAYRRSSDPQQVKLAVLGPEADSWSFYTPFEGPGQYIDIAIAGGEAHVTFYDKSACKCLKYAHASTDSMGAGQWTVEVVDDDESAEVGRYSSVAIDGDGFVHIGYFDQTNLNLKYASNVTGQFVAEVVSGNDVVEGEFEKIGRYSSLALDNDGYAHIATHYETGLSLAYLTNKEGGWTRDIIDSDGADVGRYPTLALDGNDAVHIAYRYSSEEDLRYATNASGAWQTQDVDGLNLKVGSYGSIAIDQDNNVHIAYNQGDLDYLRYATNKPGYFVAATVEDQYKCGLQTSIALDGDGVAHIFSTHNALQKLLHTTATLDCLAQGDEADSNCDGVDGTDGDLDGFASLDSGGSDCNDSDPTVQPQWVTTVLDEGPSVGEFASLAIDGQNVLHAAYYAATPMDLVYARLEPGGEWEIDTADPSGHDVGQYSSIAVSKVDEEDEEGAVVHIAYHNATSNELWYATNGTGAWVPEVVEATPEPGDDVGEHAALALDKNGFPHIAYYDVPNGLLRYASKETGVWELSTVPNDGNAGKNTAITVYKGVVYIAYQAVDSFDMMVASGGPDEWTVELVDGSDKDVGEAVSIGVDSSKKIHVTYRDANDRDLHYAVRSGGEWTLWAVDVDADVGKWSALALDGNKMVHVAYKDQDTNALLYATNVVVENYQWTKEPVTGVDGVPCGGLTTECGSHVSLSFDPMGRLHAVHYDDFNKRLLYSRKSCLGY